MKNKFSIILMLFIISISTFAKEVVNIAVLYNQEDRDIAKNKAMIMKEFSDVLSGNYIIKFPEKGQVVVENDKEKIDESYDALVKDKDIDVIVAGDNIVSNVLVQRKKIDKLTVLPFVQYISFRETSGVDNLTYSINRIEEKKILDLLRSVDKNFTEVSVIVPEKMITKSDNNARKELENKIKKLNIKKVKWIGFNGDYEKLATEVKGQKIAVLGGFSDPEEFSKIMDILNKERIITYADGYDEDITNQAYLSFEASENIQRRLRKSAISILEILDGAKAKDQKVNIDGGELRPVINQDVADLIGKWPNWRVSVSAKVIGDSSIGEKLTLYSSIRKGLEDNLNLTMNKKDLDIQEYQISIAKSYRRPQAKVAGGYKAVDEGQAEAPNDVKKENLYVGVGFRQVLWNDEINSAVSIQKSLYTAEEAKYKQKELDTVFKISMAYFNVLKLRASESIQYSNLELTKKNLELAKIREKVGYSRKSDVYRWESKMATDLSNLSKAQANLTNAKEVLINVLNADLDANFQVTDISDTEEFLGIANLELTKKNVYDKVLNELTKIGVKNSYEIKEIDGYLAAQERRKKEATRSFYSPEVALTADYKYYMDRMGDGILYSQPGEDPRKEAWVVGLEVSIPLLEGGERMAKRHSAAAEVEKFTLMREDVETKVKQNIRASLINLVSAKVSLESSKDARIAAEKTLELVTDSYSRGEVSITELLDAQNLATQAKEIENASKYDYYIKLMRTERAVGAYNLLNPDVYSELLAERNLKIQ